MPINIEETFTDYEIKLSGDFDAALAEETRAEFSKLVEHVQKNVILDLADVDFIDSSGIGAIVFLYKRLRCNNLELSLRAPKEQPLELITLLRIDKIIKVHA